MMMIIIINIIYYMYGRRVRILSSCSLSVSAPVPAKSDSIFRISGLDKMCNVHILHLPSMHISYELSILLLLIHCYIYYRHSSVFMLIPLLLEFSLGK